MLVGWLGIGVCCWFVCLVLFVAALCVLACLELVVCYAGLV